MLLCKKNVRCDILLLLYGNNSVSRMLYKDNNRG